MRSKNRLFGDLELAWGDSRMEDMLNDDSPYCDYSNMEDELYGYLERMIGQEVKSPPKIWQFHQKPLYLQAELNIEVMAQLTLQVDSPSLLEQLKTVLSLMRGVKIVSDSPVSRSATLEDVPNAETLAAMKEAESGYDAGVVRVDSLESFMASMEEQSL